MVDRIAIISEIGRNSLRGLSARGPTDFVAWQDADEVPIYTLDVANLLGSATISSVLRTSSGTVVTAPSNTTTRALQSLKQSGMTEIKITASDGQIFQFRITILPKGSTIPLRDYGWVR